MKRSVAKIIAYIISIGILLGIMFGFGYLVKWIFTFVGVA